MFKKTKGKSRNQQSTDKSQPKYQKPKILLIDLPGACVDRVLAVGFNVLAGTFGSPYKIEISDGYEPVVAKASLPNVTEQEIVIIDLTSPKTLDSPGSEKSKPDSENDWWAKCNRESIDPRPKIMYYFRGDFDRIFKHGGFFVIFAQPRLFQELVYGCAGYRGLDIKHRISKDNWSFLSTLSSFHLQIDSDYGEEIEPPKGVDQISSFLRKYVQKAFFYARFNPVPRLEKQWKSLLFNKYGDCVGGLLTAEEHKGRVLLLPQVVDKSEVLLELLRNILPNMSPHLFPDFEGLKWIERDEYELESILHLKVKKIEVQEKAEVEIEDIDSKINGERNKLGFLHGILTKQDRELVKDVELCLKLLGFTDIIDVDEQIRKIDPTQPKQEDLQIHDRSPTLLLEIKGISGLPRELDTIQIVKYTPRRMKKWNRVDVHGVSIINHQRNLPPLDRDNKNVFTQPQIDDAINHDVTILTAWDLFLLIRGMLKWKWNPQVIQELFYKKGKMPRFPATYKPIGKVVHYWDKISVVGIEISEDTLSKNDRIGYIIPTGFLEEKITSLRVDKQNVEEVKTGQIAGIKTMYLKEDLRKGTIVCKVTKGR